MTESSIYANLTTIYVVLKGLFNFKKSEMRQTSFTLSEILEQLNGTKKRTYHACGLLNEVGIICVEEKNEEAERALVSFLDSTEPGFRAISFCFLYTDEEMQKKHHEVLAEFRTKPENQTVNQDIDIMLLNFKHRAVL